MLCTYTDLVNLLHHYTYTTTFEIPWSRLGGETKTLFSFLMIYHSWIKKGENVKLKLWMHIIFFLFIFFCYICLLLIEKARAKCLSAAAFFFYRNFSFLCRGGQRVHCASTPAPAAPTPLSSLRSRFTIDRQCASTPPASHSSG